MKNGFRAKTLKVSLIFLGLNTAYGQPPLLSSDGLLPIELQESDQEVVSCLKERSPKRISALIQLNNAEQRVRDRFEALNQRLARKDVKFTDADFHETLTRIYSDTEKDLQTHYESSGSDSVLDGYRRVEASRILAETAALLSLVAAADSRVVQDFRNKAGDSLNKGIKAFTEISPVIREKELPTLVGYLAKTELNLVRLDSKREGVTNLNDSWDRMRSAVAKYRKLGGKQAQNSELDLVELEAAISLDSHELGQAGAELYLHPSRKDQVHKIQESVALEINRSTNKRFREKASQILSVSRFYSGDRSQQEALLRELHSNLNSDDPKIRKPAQKVAGDILENLGGTAVSSKTYDFLVNSLSQREMEQELSEYQKQEILRSKEYSDHLSQLMGRELVSKLGFASYQEMLRSGGAVKNLQDDYSDSLEKLAGLVRKRQSGDGDINDDEIRGIAQSVDIKWAHLQCARRQAGADSSEAVVSSPALSYQLNLSECVRHRDGVDFNKARGAAHRAIDQAIRSRISKDVVTGFSVGAAKLAYDSWDYLALLPAGYMATAARAPTKMLLKTFGKSLLKKRLFQPSWVKFGVRGATLGANTLITDFSVQSMVAAREYVEACLQGDCSPSKISENFVYTQEEADSKRHVARLMATAVANYGLDLLWGKARVFAPRSLSSLTDNKLGRWVVETSKGSVNMVVTESVGTMTEGSIGECEVPAIDILADEKKWMEAFKGSVFSKLKGSKKRSGRYVSVSLLPRLFDLGITELTPEEIQNIEKCTSFSEGDQGASLVEQDKSK